MSSARRSRLALMAWIAITAMTALGALVALPTAASASTSASVVVTSKLNPSSYGQAVGFVAKVSDPATPSSLLVGSMAFADGASVLGTVPVTSGSATFSTRTLSAGDHAITATFIPSAGGPALSSGPIVQHVGLGASTTTLSTTKAITYNGRPGAIKAKVKPVAPAFGVPTGSVDFYLDPYDPANPVGAYLTAPVDATGTATFDFAYLSGPGTYTVTAVYTGDANFGGSVSGVLTQTVLANAPSASATFSPTVVPLGGSSKLTISATNATPYAMQNVALGVTTGGRVSVVSAPAGSLCGARTGLYYCIVSIPAGATRSVVLQVTPLAPGTITANSYARNMDTGEETYASATLTVQ